MAETAILVRTFDEAWDISDSDARYTTVRCHCPELRLHRRECVFCNLGLRATNGSQQPYSFLRLGSRQDRCQPQT